jgi:hypothetical protein
MFSAPLQAGKELSPFDSNSHGINIWGHAQKLLTAEFRLVETPNTETLYSTTVLDLKDGPVVVVHPDLRAGTFAQASGTCTAIRTQLAKNRTAMHRRLTRSIGSKRRAIYLRA